MTQSRGPPPIRQIGLGKRHMRPQRSLLSRPWHAVRSPDPTAAALYCHSCALTERQESQAHPCDAVCRVIISNPGADGHDASPSNNTYPHPLVRATANDQKVMELTSSVAWTRVLLMHSKPQQKLFLRHPVSKSNHCFCLLTGISRGNFSQYGVQKQNSGVSWWPKREVKNSHFQPVFGHFVLRIQDGSCYAELPFAQNPGIRHHT